MNAIFIVWLLIIIFGRKKLSPDQIFLALVVSAFLMFVGAIFSDLPWK